VIIWSNFYPFIFATLKHIQKYKKTKNIYTALENSKERGKTKKDDHMFIYS
jgi:hypothetical protein